METIYAKALYNNTAESPDELAFHKGDVLVVLKQKVPGNVGWWQCSLLGQKGLAPANRLQLLPPALGIYHPPKPSSPTYEVMERANNISATAGKLLPADSSKTTREMHKGNQSLPRTVHTTSGLQSDVYDVPSRVTTGSLATKTKKVSAVVPQNRYEIMDTSRTHHTTDPNYDFPTPSGASGSKSLPSPLKPGWIYDVPQASRPGNDMNPWKPCVNTLPAYLWPTSSYSLYDIPKSSVTTNQSLDRIYDIPPVARPKICALETMAQRRSLDDSVRDGERGPASDLPHGQPSWSMKPSVEHKREKVGILPKSSSQRSSMESTSSSSSRSSCDSFMLNSSSPELQREVTLSQEEVAQTLLQLQEAVCQAVPRLMDFVSSRWRSREHLSQHLQEIRSAAEGVANSVSNFLDFALDVRGNARRLTDSSLQARLQKQLSIVEDSGLILQQAVDALGNLGWALDELAQDPAQSQVPDQLDRFVMVTRTMPEDVKRLVSIINANGKLLFRNASKEQDPAKDPSPCNTSISTDKREPPPDSEGDDNDYVQLQTKTEFEEHQRMTEKDDKKTDENGEDEKKLVSQPGSPTSKSQTPTRSSISNHCRLYFGALKKAITVFVNNLEEGHPPEKFITHSKLVIMVGQRLMKSLCCEAQSRQDGQEILCKSSQLCALLKQLAVATKKAALHFPDKVAVQEARDFAKELFDWVQHFRLSLSS